MKFALAAQHAHETWKLEQWWASLSPEAGFPNWFCRCAMAPSGIYQEGRKPLIILGVASESHKQKVHQGIMSNKIAADLHIDVPYTQNRM